MIYRKTPPSVKLIPWIFTGSLVMGIIAGVL